MPKIMLELKDVSKLYDKNQVTALAGINLKIAEGEFVALMGPSGCGKSTLLNMMAALDKPSSGEILIGQTCLNKLTDKESTLVRAQNIGFVFQFFNLLSTLTVEENVLLPLELHSQLPARERLKRAQECLELVGMQDRLPFYPSQLSGGQMQRVAIARALVHQPRLVIADEPTGNLDSENGARILDLLQRLNKEFKQTFVLATHSQEAAQIATRIIKMKDGAIISEDNTTLNRQTRE